MAETDGFVAWFYPQTIQVSAPPYQLSRDHAFTDLPGKSSDLVEKQGTQIGFGRQSMKSATCNVVGACLDETAKISRGKAAGQCPKGSDASAHEVVGTERRKQVGVGGRKLGLYAADITALPEALGRQGHV